MENVEPNAEMADVAPVRESTEGKKESVSEQGIKVAVRVRPLNERESTSAWRPLPQYDAITQLGPDGEPLPGPHAVFNADKVFDQEASTKELYDSVCSKVVRSVVDGINGTIFAYGQTSSGKTFTMQGSRDNVGVVQLAAEDIFAQISATTNREYLMRVAYMEIYNENLRDLLSADGNAPVMIREDPQRGVYIQCREEMISCFEDIQNALRRGEQLRTVGSTAMNERSSRSHAIFRLTIESRTCNEHSEVAVRSASLNLVDLAGSESVKNTGATGQRAKEGGKINQSLLTLSRVIQQLGDRSGSHVNFRDSKLTRLLQPMLLGNAAMAMICCVTPAEQFLEETRSTLQFAMRAKRVRLNPEINEVLDKDSQLKKLRRELAELKERQRSMDDSMAETSIDAMSVGEREDLSQQLADAQVKIEKYEKMISKDIAEGTMVVDAMAEARSRSRRGKRQRETWCPGEFQVHSFADDSADTRAQRTRRLSGVSETSMSSSSASAGGASGQQDDLMVPALEAMLERRGEQLSERETEMASLAEAIEQADARIGELEAEKSDLAQQVQVLEGELTNMNDLLQESSATHGTEVQALQQSVEELQQTVATTKEELEAKAAAYADLEAQVAAAEAEKAAAEEAMASLQAEIEKLQEANSTIKDQVVELEFKCTQLEEAQVDHEATQLEVEELRLKVDTMGDADGAVRAELEGRVAEAQAQTQALQSQLEAAECEKAALAEANAQLSAASTEAAEQLEAARTEVACLTAAGEQLAEANDKCAELAHAAESKDAELAELRSALEEMQASTAGAEEEAATKAQELGAVVEARNARLSELEAENAEAQNFIESLTSERDAAWADVEQFETQVADLGAQLASAKAEAEAAQAAQSSDDTANAQLQGSFDEAQQTIAGLQGEMEALRSECATLAESLAAATQALEQERASMTTAAAEQQAALEAKDAQLQGAVAQLQGKEEELHAAVSQLEAKDEEARNAEKDHEQVQAEMSAEMETLTDQIMDLNAQLSKEMEARKELEERADNTTAAAEVARLTTEVEALKAQLSQDVRLKEEANSAETGAQRMQAECARLRQDITSRDAEIKALREQADSMSEEMRVQKESSMGGKSLPLGGPTGGNEDALRKKISQQDYQITLLQNEVATATVKLQEAETKFSKLHREHEGAMERHSTEVASLRTQCEGADSSKVRIMNLEAANQQAAARVEALQTELKETEERANAAANAADQFSEQVEALTAKLGDGGDLSSELDAVRADCERLEQEKSAAETELASANTRLHRLQNEATMLRGEAERVMDLQQEIDALKAEAAAGEAQGDATAELEEKVQEVGAQLEAANARAVELEAKLEDAHSAARSHSHSMELELEAAKETAQKLEAEHASATEELKELKSTLNEMVQQCTQLEEANMDAGEKLSELQREHAVVSERLETAVQREEQHIAEKEELLTDLRDLKKAHEQLMDEKDALAQSAEEIRLAAAAQSAQAGAGTAEVEALKKVLEEKEARITRLEAVKFTKEHQERFQKLMKQRDENKAKADKLEKKVAKLEVELKDGARGTAAASSASTAAMELHLKEEQTRVSQLEQKLRKHVAYTQELEKGRAAAIEAGNALRSVIQQAQGGDAEAGDLAEMASRVSNELSIARESLEASKAFESEYSRLRSEFSELSSTHTETEGKLDALEESERRATEELATTKKALAELQAQLEEVGEQREKGDAATTAELKEKTREVKFLENENLQLMLEVKEMKKQASEYKAELDAMSKKMKKAPNSLGLDSDTSKGQGRQHNTRSSTKRTPTVPEIARDDGTDKARDAAASSVYKENADTSAMSNSRSTKRARRQQATTTSIPALQEVSGSTASDDNPGECKQS